MNRRLLWVDDDPQMLSTIAKCLRGQFDLYTALNVDDALFLIDSSEPFAVVVSDYEMPGADGVELLSSLKVTQPDTVRMMLTGESDQDIAVKAVNNGSVFRFLSKPIYPDEVLAAVESACRQYKLITAERELLEKTFLGSIQVMADLLALTNPTVSKEVSTVQKTTLKIAKSLGLTDLWKIEAAVILSQIGYVTLPAHTLKKVFRGHSLTENERQMVADQPNITKTLLSRIPRLEDVAEIVGLQQSDSDLSLCTKEEPIKLAASILQVVSDFRGHQYRGASSQEAVEALRKASRHYHPEVLKALSEIEDDVQELEGSLVKIADLKAGMVIDEDVETNEGVLLLPRGFRASDPIRQHLLNYCRQNKLKDSVWVLSPKVAVLQES